MEGVDAAAAAAGAAYLHPRLFERLFVVGGFTGMTGLFLPWGRLIALALLIGVD